MSTVSKNHTHELAHHYRAFVNAVLEITRVYLYQVRLDDALELLNADVLECVAKELSPRDKVQLQIQRAKIMRYKGYCDYDNALYDAALNVLFEAEKAAKDKALLADVVDLIGLTLHSKESHSDATLETRLGYFTRGLELRKDVNDQRGVVESLFHIGLVYQNKADAGEDDRQAALDYFQKAYHLAQEGNFRQEKAHVARHIAYIHARKGEWEEALTFHQEFLTVNEEVGFGLYLSPAYIMVGFAYFMKKELDKALEHCQRAHALAEEIGSKHFLADSLLMLGVVTDARGDKDTALTYYREAVAIARPINFKRVIHMASRGIEKLSNAGA